MRLCGPLASSQNPTNILSRLRRYANSTRKCCFAKHAPRAGVSGYGAGGAARGAALIVNPRSRSDAGGTELGASIIKSRAI